MLVWLDMLTPKQLLFLSEVGRRLEARGYDVFRTTRQYREVDGLLKIKDINALVVGKYGGATLEGKLASSARRVEELAHIMSRLQPGLSIAFASPDAARTAFGLSIPHYTANDSPHSEVVAKLTVPLAHKLFYPAVIPRQVWLKLGARPDQLVPYNGLDPIAWLRSSVPNPVILYDLGLDSTRPIVVFRVEESFASYLLGRAPAQSVIVPIVNEFLETYEKKVQVVALARYPEQVSAIRSAFGNNVIVPRGIVDGPGLLFFASLFIGAGGTMTAEAALLGTPSLSCYPGAPTIIEKYLIREKLVVRVIEPSKAVKRISFILDNLETQRKIQRDRALGLQAKMEDPAEVMARYVETAYPP